MARNTGWDRPSSTPSSPRLAIRADIAEIREAIAEVHIHMCMVGGSHPVVYEADWERVEEGLVYPSHLITMITSAYLVTDSGCSL